MVVAKKGPTSSKKTGFLKDASVWTIVGYITTGVLAAFLLLLLFGGRLGILNYLGLAWVFSEQTGVYADCSKPENAKVPYCQPKQSQADRQWNDIKRGGKALPFNLHD